MILRQVVDLAFEAPKIASQPKEADDQKKRSTVLCQQQGHGRGYLRCTGPGHYIAGRLYFYHKASERVARPAGKAGQTESPPLPIRW